MDRNVIFICFSGNEPFVGETSVRAVAKRFYGYVQQSLKAQDDGLVAFFDETLQPGAEWDRRIRDNLDRTLVGCGLLSLEFFQSSYVTGVELPTLLKAKKSAGILLTSLFVGSLEPSQCTVRAKDERESEYSFDLSSLNGLNPIHQPILRDGEPDDAALAAAAARLVASARNHRREKQSPSVAKRQEITLRIRTTETDIRPELLIGSQQALALRGLSRSKFSGSIAEIFPGRGPRPNFDWEAVAKRAGDKTKSPLQVPVTVGVEIDDPSILKTSFRDVLFNLESLLERGWSWVIRHPDRSEATEVRLGSDAVALVISSFDAGASSGAHGNSIYQVMKKHLGKNADIRIVTESERLGVVSVRSAAVTYVVTRARVLDGRLELNIGDQWWIDAEVLEALGDDDVPRRVVILNLLGVEFEAARDAVHRSLAPTIPILVLHTSTSIPTDTIADGSATVIGRSILEAVLQEDPVEDLARRVLRSGDAQTIVWSNGSKLLRESASTDSDLPTEFNPELLLDRLKQRGEVKNHIEERIIQQGDRVSGVLAYGAPGNFVTHFAEQVHQYLDKHPFEAPVGRFQVEFHHLSEWSCEELIRSMHHQHACAASDFRALLDSVTPFDPDHPSCSVLIVDCGTRSKAPIDEHLGPLTAWSAFLRALVEYCPSHVHLLGLIAIEIEGDAGTVRPRLTELARQSMNQDFRIRVPIELGVVEEDELFDFLVQSKRIPFNEISRVTSTLLARSENGRFDRLVDLLKPLGTCHYSEFMRSQGLTPET